MVSPEARHPLDGEIPRPGGFAPSGWFYYPGTPDDAEKEAAEEILKADELEEKARLLREAL